MFFRGRLDGLARVVLVGQEGAQDESLSHRSFTGGTGARMQYLLRHLGMDRSYLFLNSFGVGAIYRGRFQDLSLLVLADQPKVAPAGLDVLGLGAWGASGWAASWQAALDQLATRGYPKDVANPSFQLPSGRGQLPRLDLPYGTLRWVGSSGDRAVRPTDLGLGRPSPDYLKLFAPSWVAQLASAPLTPAEQAAADQL